MNLHRQAERWKLSHHLPPFKLKYFLGPNLPPIRRILDVGCGNNSATLTKIWFPNAAYVGIDRDDYNNNPQDYALMDSFVKANLETDSLATVEDDAFDLVIMSHVIEHLERGEEAVSRLARKLRPGGYFYLECPSKFSLHLPSGVDSLNFFDDPTHVRIYDLPQVCSVAGLRVVRSGIRRDWVRVVLGLTILLPKQLASLLKHHKLYGPSLWDFLGFAQYAIARRPVD